MKHKTKKSNEAATIFANYLEGHDIVTPEIKNISMFDFIDCYNKMALEKPCHISIATCAKSNRIVFTMDISGLDTEFLFAPDSIMISNYSERTLDPAHELPTRNMLTLDEISTIARFDDGQTSHFMFADVNGDLLAIMTLFPPMEGDELLEDK